MWSGFWWIYIGEVDIDLGAWKETEILSLDILNFAQKLHKFDPPRARDRIPRVCFVGESDEILVYFVREYNIFIPGIPREKVCSVLVPFSMAQKLDCSYA